MKILIIISALIAVCLARSLPKEEFDNSSINNSQLLSNQESEFGSVIQKKSMVTGTFGKMQEYELKDNVNHYGRHKTTKKPFKPIPAIGKI